jgi:D-arabinan exo alpha-(1,3)/(1,5)-arabinofuranosidase (non-reducing end)
MENLYTLSNGLKSRSISFENPTGTPGSGGKVASPLGAGRKGDPARLVKPGETVELVNIEGSGTIRHIWATMPAIPKAVRGAVLRIWWEGQEHPSVEAPVGDFFGFAHGKTKEFQTAAHSVGSAQGMNAWLHMPFTKSARMTLTNESAKPFPFFYQVDYTLDDSHDASVGRLHVLFRRENPTTKGKDFVLLPKREGRGTFIGTVLGVRPLHKAWWGEGEIKFFMDGDDALPTICGTGSEDYVGLSWGLQENAFMYNGASLCERDGSDTGFISMYRWHMKDPIYWDKDCHVTIQQIGHEGPSPNLEAYKANLFEREDDWCATTFWYEPVPSAPLPDLPSVDDRSKDLWMGPAQNVNHPGD